MKCPTTPDEWRAIEDKFMKSLASYLWCTWWQARLHQVFTNSGTLYYNYKGFYPAVILALINADYKFIWADIGGMGSASGAQISATPLS